MRRQPIRSDFDVVFGRNTRVNESFLERLSNYLFFRKHNFFYQKKKLKILSTRICSSKHAFTIKI